MLFASLVEARGLSAMLILTPAHILPAVATGLPEEAALWVHGDPGRFVRHGGALWVPIEATRLEASFVEAWRAGAEHVQEALRRGEKVGFVAVREGWKRFPPAGLERAEGAELASLGGAEAAIARELRSLADERKKVAEREAADEGRSRGERALLYASMGRLEDARTLLRGKAGAARAPLEQLVNRGNLELVSGHPDRALSAYGEALRKAAGDARVHMNAGLAAWAKGDIEAFDEHILSCVENGGTDLVRRMSRILSGGARPPAGALESHAEHDHVEWPARSPAALGATGRARPPRGPAPRSPTRPTRSWRS